MNRRSTAPAVISAITLALSACSGDAPAATSPDPTATSEESPTSESDPSEHTVTIVHDGESANYTCDEITHAECGSNMRVVFESLEGPEIYEYVNSGQLGALNDDPYVFEDAAYAGILACAIRHMDQGRDAYVDWMLEALPEMAEEVGGVAYFPAWSAAGDYLCPPDA